MPEIVRPEHVAAFLRRRRRLDHLHPMLPTPLRIRTLEGPPRRLKPPRRHHRAGAPFVAGPADNVPQVSPDGRTIAFQHATATGRNGIATVNLPEADCAT